MRQLLIVGEPSTVTAQQKGISWKHHLHFTKLIVEAEGARMRRNLHEWNGTKFVRVSATTAMTPLKGPLQVSVKFVFPLTALQAKQHVASLGDPLFELHHGKQPDLDNVLKLLLDVLTKAGCWENDGQIDDLNLHKRRGTDPRIVINCVSWDAP